ncbi:hypothetical protein Bra3105_16285 [Brachybacterium halotolerans subsp. kimchii]|uniref:hypothetical protein n=1 Tax=Brachybacterium halotolerans TaxID=2795215 RepID=UPI001E48FA62|nr:hypothetical protein [Brachybacterium halotolerans]UEJ82374.1 hypothetical protein Bra3105_16285 [Brachybacterium halotolerans subsp. kimchii]
MSAGLMSAGTIGLATLGGRLLAAPSDSGDMTATTVTPGLPAFIVMFVLAAAIVLLALDMTRRVRRIQARSRAEGHLAEEGRGEGTGSADGTEPADSTEPVDGTKPADGAGPVDGAAPADENRPADGEAPSDDGDFEGGEGGRPRD